MAARRIFSVLWRHVARVGAAVMPDLRPTAAEYSAATGETQPDAQLEHLFPGGELLAKVLPAGEPLVAAVRTCTVCGQARGVGPQPFGCLYFPGMPGCCPMENGA